MPLVACQRDATLRTLQTEVLACTPAGDHHEVVLADTVLYPEGGGQPADHGQIAGVPVDDVRLRDGVVVHRTRGPVALGTVEVAVDWARRFDHMQQHTGQHLLTAVAQDRFGWPTTSFHLHPRTPGGPVPLCDIELGGEPTDAQLVELERAVNAAIREDRAVGWREVDRPTWEAMAIRSRGIPDHVEQVRIVEIDGIDANTCGGTHVAGLGELQCLKLFGTERIRGGTRLFYAAGDRVLDLLDEAHRRTLDLNKALSEGPEAHVAAVQRLIDRAKSADKVVKGLQLELAAHLGASLAPLEGPVLGLHRDQGDTAFLNAVATAALGPDDSRCLVLTAGEGDAGFFLVAGPPERVAAHKAAILEALDGRGGGRPGRLQGKANRLSGGRAVQDLLGNP